MSNNGTRPCAQRSSKKKKKKKNHLKQHKFRCTRISFICFLLVHVSDFEFTQSIDFVPGGGAFSLRASARAGRMRARVAAAAWHHTPGVPPTRHHPPAGVGGHLADAYTRIAAAVPGKTWVVAGVPRGDLDLGAASDAGVGPHVAELAASRAAEIPAAGRARPADPRVRQVPRRGRHRLARYAVPGVISTSPLVVPPQQAIHLRTTWARFVVLFVKHARCVCVCVCVCACACACVCVCARALPQTCVLTSRSRDMPPTLVGGYCRLRTSQLTALLWCMRSRVVVGASLCKVANSQNLP